MNKKEQIAFMKPIKEKVKAKGYLMSYFLGVIHVSPSHWHFLKNGERPLTDDMKNKIEKFINT
jgi:hypothetical protein